MPPQSAVRGVVSVGVDNISSLPIPGVVSIFGVFSGDRRAAILDLTMVAANQETESPEDSQPESRICSTQILYTTRDFIYILVAYLIFYGKPIIRFYNLTLFITVITWVYFENHFVMYLYSSSILDS